MRTFWECFDTAFILIMRTTSKMENSVGLTRFPNPTSIAVLRDLFLVSSDQQQLTKSDSFTDHVRFVTHTICTNQNVTLVLVGSVSSGTIAYMYKLLTWNLCKWPFTQRIESCATLFASGKWKIIIGNLIYTSLAECLYIPKEFVLKCFNFKD